VKVVKTFIDENGHKSTLFRISASLIGGAMIPATRRWR
jgi:hypothetical protein